MIILCRRARHLCSAEVYEECRMRVHPRVSGNEEKQAAQRRCRGRRLPTTTATSTASVAATASATTSTTVVIVSTPVCLVCRDRTDGIPIASHLLELRRDDLVGLAQDRAQVSRSLGVLAGEERDGGAAGARTSRTTDAVDIVLDVVGEVVVDDVGDVLDICIWRSVIGGHDTQRRGKRNHTTRRLHTRYALFLDRPTWTQGEPCIASAKIPHGERRM